MKKPLVRFSILALACSAALAQTDLGVTGAAQKAIGSSPEVAAKFNAFRASVDEIDAAAAGYRPKLDLTADLGRTEDRITSRNPADQGLNRGGVALNLTQMLWDGLATSNEVARLSHSKMARYFEFLDATEQTALEALRAHHDVLRYRRLVSLAEDNYVQHKYAYDQIQSRVRAGVARGVDLEQSGARLALAESNLVTEKANLHDVTERYRRIVGEPPEALATAAMPMKRPWPVSAAAAIEGSARFSPVIAGAVEGLRAVRAQAEVRKSAFQPRIEARLRAGGGHNFDGVEDQKRDVSAQLALTWNLFNGGADDARQRQQVHLLNQATDLRDKACRDTRQTVAIAYNDVRKLEEQLVYLDRNVTAIEKARDAYRQQFDIGQRSLLDLLNAENEVYTARRAYALAVADRDIAIGRTHASIGTLVAALGLTRPDTLGLAAESEGWEAGRDAASRCPLSPTDLPGMSRADLDARARAMAVPTAALLPATPAPVAPVAAPAAPTALAPAAAAEQRLRDWAAAWSAKDFTRYQAFYSPAFSPSQGDKARWLADRQRRVTKPGEIRVEVLNVEAKAVSPTQVETRFEQAYQSANYSDRSAKTLTWEQAGGTWLIVRESNR
ncbi:MAG: TolC family outer membrane protein [Vitreoscilla sp.]|nr:TolC family outer membrane protein [Vitreoscilla sp.]